MNDLGLTNYRVAAFLEADEMASAYASATLIVSRSGGSLAEVALFQLPSVLIPLPSSAGNHQLYNAQEFVEMGAATLRIQASASPEQLAADIAAWLDHPAKRVEAAKALKLFDAPEATENILKMIERAAS